MILDRLMNCVVDWRTDSVDRQDHWITCNHWIACKIGAFNWLAFRPGARATLFDDDRGIGRVVELIDIADTLLPATATEEE